MTFSPGGILGKISGGLLTIAPVADTLCLRRVEPASGSVGGGTSVRVYIKAHGENVIAVTFNGVAAEITGAADTYIDVITPIGAPGLASVRVATLVLSDTLIDEFNYYQIVEGEGPFRADVLKTKENYHYIEWEFDPSEGQSIDDYKFNIYWSNSQDCDFNAILDGEGEMVEIDGAVGPLVYTHEVKQYDFNLKYYYKVHAILKSSPATNSYSEVAFIGMHYDGIHAIMHEAENVLYDMFYGEPAYLIKKKANGTRCTNCWSETRQQRTLTHCDTCDGSGFIDGYYCAIPAQIAFDSEDVKSDSQRNFEDTYDSKRARMSNYPIVRAKDIVINKDEYKRYVVMHVETTKLPRHSSSNVLLSKQNYIVSQLLTLQELNPSDNEYNISVTGLT